MTLLFRALFAAAAFSVPSLGAAEEPGKPNILFLFADDMTWKAVRSLGKEDIDTPNLDRLAARGTAFTHAHNAGGWHGAVCVASRSMLLTGRQLWRARDAEPRLNEEFTARGKLWPQLMASAGYRTCFSGKWHIQADHEKAFAEIRHYRPGGMPKDRKNAYGRPVEGAPDTWRAEDVAEGGFWEGGTHWSQVVAEDFQAFLASPDLRPWFMYLAFNAPHDPRQAPAEYLERYPLSRVKVPANFQPLHPLRAAMGVDKGMRDEDLAPFPRTEFAVKTHRREYYAAISYLDSRLGVILDALEKSPAGANTVIFFTADHGLACGEHGLLGKQNLYDASVRVPLLVAGPGVPAGLKVEAPVYLQDCMPTALRMAGAEKPADADFRDLRPLWEKTGAPRDVITGAYMDSQRMIERPDGKKLILLPKAKTAELYDLKADPEELRNLLAEPGGRELARELFAQWEKARAETGDTLDLREEFPDLITP